MPPPSLVFVAGARPNFVKIAPVLRALARRRSFSDVLVHTGQHYDFALSGVFFEQLGIREPDVYLQVGSASHGVQTGRIPARSCGERAHILLERGHDRRPMRITVIGTGAGFSEFGYDVTCPDGDAKRIDAAAATRSSRAAPDSRGGWGAINRDRLVERAAEARSR